MIFTCYGDDFELFKDTIGGVVKFKVVNMLIWLFFKMIFV
jgi:hypothetical protein